MRSAFWKTGKYCLIELYLQPLQKFNAVPGKKLK